LFVTEKRWLVERVVVPIVIALVVPVTTLIYQCGAQERERLAAMVVKDRELKLAETAKQRELKLAEVTQQYHVLDRVLSAQGSKQQRKIMLTFLIEVSADESIQMWARDQLSAVNRELDELEKLPELQKTARAYVALQRELAARKAEEEGQLAPMGYYGHRAHVPEDSK
jgi:hypothetical protein